MPAKKESTKLNKSTEATKRPKANPSTTQKNKIIRIKISIQLNPKTGIYKEVIVVKIEETFMR